MNDKVIAAIDAYATSRGWDGDADTILCLLLADARTFADLHGLDFGVVDREAYQVYVETK